MKATPYTKDYEHITDIDQFFDYNDTTKEMVFTGISLICYIPQRYETYHLLTMADTVTTLAVFDMIFEDRFQASLLMLTTIEMEPDDVSKIMVGDVAYIKLTLSTGARFICNTERIADSAITYAVWMEFITRGKLLYSIGYDKLATLFDKAQALCGINLAADHVILEMIYSHLSRAQDNMTVQYRHTDQKDPFTLIPLRSVGYATDSTASKLNGSYFGSALNSSLIQTNEEFSDIEQILRS